MPWTVAALRDSILSFPTAPSRALFWGLSSNAGGHPLDLHKKSPPPSPPHALGPSRSVDPLFQTATHDPGKTRLVINSNVRQHLYEIFFTHIQPVWPVVTRLSLARYPHNTLLDAAILGCAARHHSAIASMRDFAHIQDVLTTELKDLFSLREPYQPDLQTLQGLLVVLLRLELCTRTHADLFRYSLHTSFACTMAQDLGLHLSDTAGKFDQADLELRENMWATCVHQDAYCSAALGQTLNISDHITQNLSTVLYVKISGSKDQSSSFSQHACFFHLTALSCCLRLILRHLFGPNPATGTALRDQASSILVQIQWHQNQLNLLQNNYELQTYRALQMLHNNNRLLFILGLRSLLPEHDDVSNSVRTMLIQHSGSLVFEACQTVEYSTPELLRSLPGQLNIILYANSRALMVVVDALRDARHGAVFPRPLVDRLHAAVASAEDFMHFLLRDHTWGVHWTQGHTMKAILARLDQHDDNRITTQEPGTTADQVIPTETAPQTQHNPSPGSGHWDMTMNGTDFVDSALQSTDWNAFFADYDQIVNWPSLNDFEMSW
ncbi:hypothetical protein A1O3_08115 [Capronia epimyces CBS 606.96]|uniref:Xylanolytic transcriptional activator regulatory domain-containing protein n=1 Tax=Capronia epimyces CBS 606.96 TaxID=1182542 RepID=W9XR97_9EURO|nr:uncharacterized protein A1O3_08115 [Capronia epimyces CBS 606.96]EXJ79830.1 hypothetical protein A1O3_08115 [Capronia epimyces CBS 606.96]